MKLEFGNQESIDAANAAIKLPPISRMYLSFGQNHGQLCGTCTHFIHDRFHDKHRCSLWCGTQKATKWDPDFTSCGKYEHGF